jgi:hypothetical protein
MHGMTLSPSGKSRPSPRCRPTPLSGHFQNRVLCHSVLFSTLGLKLTLWCAQGGIEAAQLAARRAGATAEALGPFAFSGQQIVINVDKTGTAPEQSVARPTTINTFIAGGETTELAIKTRIMQLCTNATLGTDATGGLTVFSGFATEAEKNKVFDSSNVNILPGVCTYCLTQVTLRGTPHFFLISLAVLVPARRHEKKNA